MMIRLLNLIITTALLLCSSPLKAQQIGSVECTAMLMHLMWDANSETEEIHCDLADYSATYELIDLPKSFKETYFLGLQSGTLVVNFDGVDVNAKSISFKDAEQWSVSRNPQSDRQKELSEGSGVSGVKNVLVVYITAHEDASLNDPRTATSSFTPALISDLIFGTNGDPITMASQFNACSHGKLTMRPQTGDNIVGGVVSVDIDIDEKVEAMSFSEVRIKAIVSVIERIGDAAYEATDFVMFAIPVGVKGPPGSAGGNYTHYRDERIGTLLVNMHEIGHNMNLRHSGAGTFKYADSSGSMGGGIVGH